MLTAISIERETGSKTLVRVGDELASCHSRWGWGVGRGHTCVRAAGPEAGRGQLLPSWACSVCLDCAEGPGGFHLLRDTLPYAPRVTDTWVECQVRE